MFPQQDLADRLRQALEESGVTQAELARACGVTDQAVYKWLKDGRIAKQHLVMISYMTKKPLEFFLVGLKTWRRVAALALFFLLPQPFVAFDAKAFDIIFFTPLAQHKYTLENLLRRLLFSLSNLVRKRTRRISIPLHVFDLRQMSQPQAC